MRPRARPPLGFAIASLGVTQIIGWGTSFYLPAIIAQPVSTSLEISGTVYLLAFSWCLLLAGLASRRLGRLIDRVGAAPVLAGGSLINALALTLHALADSSWMIWISWTLIGLCLRAVLYDGAFAALTALSGTQARRSISILTLMGGLASTVFWPIGGWLTEWSDWRTTLLIYAALNALVCAPLHWWGAGMLPSNRTEPGAVQPNPPPLQGTLPAASTEPDRTARDYEAFQTRATHLLAAALALHALISYALSTHLPALLQGLGLTGSAALLAASLMGPAQVLARIAELGVQRTVPALSITIPVFLLMPIAFVGFIALPIVPTNQAALAGAAVVMIWGASNGLMTIIRGTLPVSLFGTANYGEMLGRLAAPSLYLGAIAPVWFGMVLTWVGPVGAAAILLGLSGLAVVLAARLVALARRQAASSIQAC
ncbi:MAG: hypothetical protein RL322_3002 [Pseudomonadota bacterium]|jgi:MFS family permease